MKQKRWMGAVLKLAAVYNVIWGAWVVLFPEHFFEITNMQVPDNLIIWQGMGMIVGVNGIGYWLASYDAIRHWPILLVGFLGKIFGPLGFIMNYFILKTVHETTNWKLNA